MSSSLVMIHLDRWLTEKGQGVGFLTNVWERGMKEIVRQFKAFSDETRLRILHLLLKGELCICELMEVLELPQSRVSRHMAYLRNTGLVKDRREAVWIYYSLTEPNNRIHASQLNCLAECFGGYEVLRADQARLDALRARKQGTCCTPPRSAR